MQRTEQSPIGLGCLVGDLSLGATPVGSREMTPRVRTEDLIDAQGVADLLGLSHRNTISSYQKRYPQDATTDC
jgi:hypothetical protein